MPAHITLKDRIASGVALGTQFLPERGRGVANSMGLSRGPAWQHLQTTEKGRNVIKSVQGGHLRGGYITPGGAVGLLERERAHREIHCHDYQTYRQALDDIHRGTDNDSSWRKRGGDFASRITNLSGEGYDEKAHDHYKDEWRLYLKAGTVFDAEVKGFLDRNWTILLIKGREKRAKQLRRIEATKNHATSSGQKLVILWTST